MWKSKQCISVLMFTVNVKLLQLLYPACELALQFLEGLEPLECSVVDPGNEVPPQQVATESGVRSTPLPVASPGDAVVWL